MFFLNTKITPYIIITFFIELYYTNIIYSHINSSDWSEILQYTTEINPKKFQYALNVVARIISMSYHLSLHKVERLLYPALKNIDVESVDASDLIHECVKYIIAQYRAMLI